MTTCDFVSCPEMYWLANMPRYNASAQLAIYETFCDGDRYWLGIYNNDVWWLSYTRFGVH
jgi:hypothetical protein